MNEIIECVVMNKGMEESKVLKAKLFIQHLRVRCKRTICMCLLKTKPCMSSVYVFALQSVYSAGHFGEKLSSECNAL